MSIYIQGHDSIDVSLHQSVLHALSWCHDGPLAHPSDDHPGGKKQESFRGYRRRRLSISPVLMVRQGGAVRAVILELIMELLGQLAPLSWGIDPSSQLLGPHSLAVGDAHIDVMELDGVLAGYVAPVWWCRPEAALDLLIPSDVILDLLVHATPCGVDPGGAGAGVVTGREGIPPDGPAGCHAPQGLSQHLLGMVCVWVMYIRLWSSPQALTLSPKP